jgi:hypothetical protein
MDTPVMNAVQMMSGGMNAVRMLGISGVSLGDVLELLPQTVTRLRVGAPAVQWLVAVDSDNEQLSESLEAVETALASSSFQGESFQLQKPELRQGAVITITRSFEPRTENVNFGQLKCGEEFFIVDDTYPRHYIKAAFSQSKGLAVVIGEMLKGEVAYLPEDLKVLKIFK